MATKAYGEQKFYEGEPLMEEKTIVTPQELSFTYDMLSRFVDSISKTEEATRLANANEDESKSKYWYLSGQISAYASVKNVIINYLTTVRDELVQSQKGTKTESEPIPASEPEIEILDVENE